jgi:polyribonucleotide nucleotidyltransferase
MEESDLDLIVAGTREAITMIEGFARDIPEDQMLAAIMFAHKHVVQIVELIEALRPALGLPEKQLPPPPPVNPLIEEFRQKFGEEFRQRKFTEGKLARAAAVAELKERILAEYLPAQPAEGATVYEPSQVHAALNALEEYVVRQATSTADASTAAPPNNSAPSSARSASCPAPTARPCSSVARRKRWSPPRWAP